MKTMTLFFAVVLAMLTGCVAVAPYQTVIDTRGVDPNQYNADSAQCQQVSIMQVDRGASTAGSAVLGAIIGGLIGGATGGRHHGGNVGAGMLAGGLIGGVAGDANSAQAQRNIFFNCMTQRGYRVITVPQPY